MLEALIIKILREGILLIILLSLGPMLTALFVGLIISLFQATTQIQEQTLTFVPKIIAVFLVLALLGPWIIAHLVKFANMLFNLIPLVCK